MISLTSLWSQSLLRFVHHETGGLRANHRLKTGCSGSLTVSHRDGRGCAWLEDLEASIVSNIGNIHLVLCKAVAEGLSGIINCLCLFLSKHTISLFFFIANLLQLFFQADVFLADRAMLLLKVDYLLDEQICIFLLT